MSRYFDVDGKDAPATYAVTEGPFSASPVAHEPGGGHPHGQGSSAEGADLPEASMDTLVDYLVQGYWQARGSSPRKFDTSDSNHITVNMASLEGLSGEGQRLATSAMLAWQAVANIKFVQIKDPTGQAQLRFQDTEDGAYAGARVSEGNTINASINVSSTWLSDHGTDIDSYAFFTYIHEIGHALGLGHPGNYGGTGVTYLKDAAFANDSYQLTVMSYFSQVENTDVDASEASPVTPMMVDILAIQSIYGAPDASSPTAGDTVWGHNSNLDGYLGDFFRSLRSDLGGKAIAFTIYDRDGTDTFDLSSSSTDDKIDLRGGAFSDVGGLRGNVAIVPGTVIEKAIGGGGDNSIIGNSLANELSGKGGNDTLHGGEGADTLDGGEGSDTLEGGAGADMLDGKLAQDMADYGMSNTAVTVNLGTGVTGGGHSEGDQLTSIENLGGSAFGDRLTGDAGANDLSGEAGTDTLSGEGGADLLAGGRDADLLMGGGGADTLMGGAGEDRLFGGAEADQLDGGSGTDLLRGGAGADTLDGGTGIDTADYSQSAAAVMASLAGQGSGQGGDAAGDTYRGIENLVGSAMADVLTGSDGANLLQGGAGADTLDGGLEEDTLDGGSEVDMVDYGRSNAAVKVNLGTGQTCGGHADCDQLIDIEALSGSTFGDSLTGDAGANSLSGQGGDDALSGAGGADLLSGGAGADTLEGGAGADIFVFQGDGSSDLVQDFEDGVDMLRILADESSANLQIGSNGADATVTFSSDGVTTQITLAGAAGLISNADIEFMAAADANTQPDPFDTVI